MTATVEEHVKLGEHGAVLAGRSHAIELRAELTRRVHDDGVVVLDFADIEAISPSFADEIFGRFVDEVGLEHVEMRNLSQHIELVARMVRRQSPS